LPANFNIVEKKDLIYFISDAHQGIHNHSKRLEREKKLVRLLDEAAKDATEIFLLGDIFDFWFEYRTVVPKGFVRLLGKIAQITDAGIPVHYFTGNHDMWIFKYFSDELGVTMHYSPVERTFDGKLFLIGHGDGLGPGDHGYKLLKKVFSGKVSQFLFSWIHPDIGAGIALFFSKKSRLANESKDDIFLGEEKERLIAFCIKALNKKPFDYFIFGHRHLPLYIEIVPGVKYINTGDWVKSYSYAVFNKGQLHLKFFYPPNHQA